jgi:hypothetical protein
VFSFGAYHFTSRRWGSELLRLRVRTALSEVGGQIRRKTANAQEARATQPRNGGCPRVIAPRLLTKEEVTAIN